MKTKILLVDDHPMLRSGLRQEVAQKPNLELVGDTGQWWFEHRSRLATDR